MLLLENQFYSLEFHDDGGVVLRIRKNGSCYKTQPAEIPCRAVAVSEDSAELRLETLEGPVKALWHLENERIQLKLQGHSNSFLMLPYPPAWIAEVPEKALLPIGSGYAFPVEMPEPSIPQEMLFFSGSSASMGIFGLWGGRGCLLSVPEHLCDSKLNLKRSETGILQANIVWLAEKHHWGYERNFDVIWGASLGEAMRQYRKIRTQQGFVRTLREKCAVTPEVSKLSGAADLWLWDDNNMNRLYGRPESRNITPRNIRAVAADLISAGMTRILWNSFEGETPEDCAYLKQQGFLVGKYDVYRDVLPKNVAEKIIAYRRKRSVNTPFWPEIVRMQENGELAPAWAVHGIDGSMYEQHAVCESEALKLTRQNVPPDVKRVGYNSRFIDVQSGSMLAECYCPAHPATRRDSRNFINAQNNFLADSGLVTGVEVGSENFIQSYHFSEGMLSPGMYRAENAGRRMTDLYYGKEIPIQITQRMLNPVYRVPLWELAYHDCCVNFWYWGDSSNSSPELMMRRDLFDILYGEAPLYSLSMSQWGMLKRQIAASYHRVSPVAQAVAWAQMVDFRWLDAAGEVQQTVFDNGITITVNFSHTTCVVDGNKVTPESYMIQKPTIMEVKS